MSKEKPFALRLDESTQMIVASINHAVSVNKLPYQVVNLILEGISVQVRHEAEEELKIAKEKFNKEEKEEVKDE